MLDYLGGTMQSQDSLNVEDRGNKNKRYQRYMIWEALVSPIANFDSERGPQAKECGWSLKEIARKQVMP